MKRNVWLLAVVCAGCATQPRVAPPLGALSSEVAALRVAIAIPEEDKARIDVIDGASGQSFRSGEIFATVFTGGPSNPTLKIQSTSSNWAITDLGFTGVFTYRITAILNDGNGPRTFVATGVERAHGARMPQTYAQIACERAVVDLARQLQSK